MQFLRIFDSSGRGRLANALPYALQRAGFTQVQRCPVVEADFLVTYQGQPYTIFCASGLMTPIFVADVRTHSTHNPWLAGRQVFIVTDTPQRHSILTELTVLKFRLALCQRHWFRRNTLTIVTEENLAGAPPATPTGKAGLTHLLSGGDTPS
jgi:hypothetical protein